MKKRPRKLKVLSFTRFRTLYTADTLPEQGIAKSQRLFGIDAGRLLKINKDVRVLYHTKGLVLTDIAIGTEGEEIARRRLVQAEKAFRHGIAMNPRDEYSYQGLALLFLKWAKHIPAETTEYIAKCEETISEGLRTVNVREGLWLVSAEVQQFLGSAPKYEQALERAIRENPKSV